MSNRKANRAAASAARKELKVSNDNATQPANNGPQAVPLSPEKKAMGEISNLFVLARQRADVCFNQHSTAGDFKTFSDTMLLLNKAMQSLKTARKL